MYIKGVIMSFLDAALPNYTITSEAHGIAMTPDYKLTREALEYKKKMHASQSDVEAAKQALEHSKKTKTDKTVKEGLQNKLDAAKQKRDKVVQDCNEHFNGSCQTTLQEFGYVPLMILSTLDDRLTPDALVFKRRMQACEAAVHAAKLACQNPYMKCHDSDRKARVRNAASEAKDQCFYDCRMHFKEVSFLLAGYATCKL